MEPGTLTMKTISVVIPARNERDGIEKTIRTIPKGELEGMGYEVQILVVDNDSNDGSGELAKKAGVGTLLLTHISRRYREDQVLEEARAVFPDTFVAKDFDRFQVKRGECKKV